MLATQPRKVFTPEHEQFRTTVKRFFRDEVEPNIKEWETAGAFDPAIFRKAGQYGLLQAGIPVEYGGMGGDFMHHAILHEEHGYSLGGASMGGGFGTDGSSYLIYAGGTEAQKKEWLPRYASGELIAEVCFTEPHCGSDIGAIRTVAKPSGGDYVINGSKMWVTNGTLCTMLPVFARIDRPDGKAATGIFLVDADMPGVQKSKPIRTIHQGCAVEAEVFFEDVRVPADRLLGEDPNGNALKNIVPVLVNMRAAQALRFQAAAETGFDLTVEYVKNRRAFGQTVFDFQNTQFQLADVKTELTVMRAFLDQCLLKMREGTLTAEESAMAKLAASETEFRALDRCLQLYGGMGVAHEMPISQLWTAARIHRIYLGTSEIQRQVIARSI